VSRQVTMLPGDAAWRCCLAMLSGDAGEAVHAFWRLLLLDEQASHDAVKHR